MCMVVEVGDVWKLWWPAFDFHARARTFLAFGCVRSSPARTLFLGGIGTRVLRIVVGRSIF
jgi:hypothetical protein